MAEKGPESIQLPLEWHVPEGMVGLYATSLVVQHTENEFLIHFFQVRPPLVLGSPDEVKAKLQEIGSVRADCVGCIIVAAERMESFIKVLAESLEGYRAKQEE